VLKDGLAQLLLNFQSLTQISSLLKSLAILEMGGLKRAVEMCFSCGGPAATNGEGEGYLYPSSKN
jgi:hypothetical protein